MILDMLKKQNKKENIIPEEKVEESINEGTLLDVLTSIEKEIKESLTINEETAGSAFTKNMVPENEDGDNIYQILDGCARQASAFYKMLEARIRRGKGNFDSIQASGKTNTFNPLFIGPTGTGKAQPLTSKVYTPEGYKLMKDIQKGDIILDGNGNATKVLEVFPQEVKHDIYRICFDDNTSIEVADNHLNSVCTCNRNKKSAKINLILNTVELYNYVNNPKYRSWAYPRLYIEPVTINAWKSNNLPVDPYLLGCLLGDGCLGGKGTTLGFTSADSELVEAVDNILRRDWNLKLSLHDQYNYNICTIDSEKNCTRKEKAAFKEVMNNLGVCVKSEFKFIPDLYKYSSYEDRLALVRGLMDTDGTISKQKLSNWTQNNVGGKCSFSSSSQQLAEDLSFILRSLGCRVSISIQHNRKYRYNHNGVDEMRDCLDAYTLYITQPTGLSLFNLSRKAKLQLKARFEPRRSITAVELLRQDDCKCLYVESDCHTYITDNLTVTHNTSIVKAWAKDKGYELVTLNMMGDALDFLGVKTINKDYDLTLDDEGNTKKTNRVETIPTKVFDKFLTGKIKVLFLDEINKTNPRILQALYDLISFHTVQNGDEVMFLPKLLFTVGAMNPSEYGNREPLDPALKARMEIYPVTYDSISLKKYLLKEIGESIDTAKEELADLENEKDSDEAKFWASQYEEYSSKKDLVEKLFEDPKKFIWSDPEKLSDGGDTTLALVPRTLEAALNNCDGTKIGFLKAVLIHCGMEAVNMIKDILNDYQDKEHKANQIWGKDYSVKEEEPEVEDEDEVLDREEGEEDINLQSNNVLSTLDDIVSTLHDTNDSRS